METVNKQSRSEQLLADLHGWFRNQSQVVVAFSGGVDSALVLASAVQALGTERVLAITADSPSLARIDLTEARQFVEALGVEHHELQTRELDDARYRANSGDRCYFCKFTLYAELSKFLHEVPDESPLARFRHSPVVDGTNVDDLQDVRPGRKAAAEAKVRHPLAELGFRKADVRAVSQYCGLSTWDKPEMACLASRITTGVAVTAENLALVEAAESALTALGFRGHRVRYHEFPSAQPVVAESAQSLGSQRLARIELDGEALARACQPFERARISESLCELGFTFVTLDLQGYRKGGRPMTEATSLVSISPRAGVVR